MNIKKIIPIVALASIMSLSFVSKNIEVSADSDFVPIAEDWQRSRIRLHHDNNLHMDYLGTHWNTYPFKNLDNSDAYYFRIVMNAQSEGDYDISFTYVGEDYRVRYYLNDNDYIDKTLDGSWSEIRTNTETFHLNEGKNVLIIQLCDYGGIISYKLPEGVSIVKHSTTETFYFEEQDNLNVWLRGNVKDPNANLFVGPLKFDSDSDFNAKASVHINNQFGEHSLDFTYQLIENPSNPYINVSVNDGPVESLLLPDQQLNMLHTMTISTSVLARLDYDFSLGATNKITLSSPLVSSNCILLDTMTINHDTEPVGESYKVEAEKCDITGRYIVRTPVYDWEAWSDGKYVGNTGPEKAISNVSEITEDGSTVKIFEIPVTVDRASRYALRVAYAFDSDISTRIYYKENATSSYKTHVLMSSGGWATPCALSEPMYVSLKQGENKVYVTGPSTSGSWANYDYFMFTSVSDTNNVYTNVVGSNLYTIHGLDGFYPKGSDVSFRVALTEYASQFTGEYHVFVNDQEVNKTPTGDYVVNNVQEDLEIEVRGIVSNVWHIYYYDEDKVVLEKEYHVGDSIEDYKLKDRFHLRFDGWEGDEIPGQMPNHDITVKARFVEDNSVGNPSLGLIIGLSAGGVALLAGSIFIAGTTVAVILIVKNVKKRKAVTK